MTASLAGVHGFLLCMCYCIYMDGVFGWRSLSKGGYMSIYVIRRRGGAFWSWRTTCILWRKSGSMFYGWLHGCMVIVGRCMIPMAHFDGLGCLAESCRVVNMLGGFACTPTRVSLHRNKNDSHTLVLFLHTSLVLIDITLFRSDFDMCSDVGKISWWRWKYVSSKLFPRSTSGCQNWWSKEGATWFQRGPNCDTVSSELRDRRLLLSYLNVI